MAWAVKVLDAGREAFVVTPMRHIATLKEEM